MIFMLFGYEILKKNLSVCRYCTIEMCMKLSIVLNRFFMYIFGCNNPVMFQFRNISTAEAL